MDRKRSLLKFCDLKGMTFNSICLIPLLRIFRKSKVVPWMLFFLLETTHGVSKLKALVVQTRKTEGRTIS